MSMSGKATIGFALVFYEPIQSEVSAAFTNNLSTCPTMPGGN